MADGRNGARFAVLIAKPLDTPLLEEIASRTRGSALVSDGKRALISTGRPRRWISSSARSEARPPASRGTGTGAPPRRSRLSSGSGPRCACVQRRPASRGADRALVRGGTACWSPSGSASAPAPGRSRSRTRARRCLRPAQRSLPRHPQRSEPADPKRPNRPIRSDPGKTANTRSPIRAGAPTRARGEGFRIRSSAPASRPVLPRRPAGGGWHGRDLHGVAFGAENFRRAFVIKLLHSNAQRRSRWWRCSSTRRSSLPTSSTRPASGAPPSSAYGDASRTASPRSRGDQHCWRDVTRGRLPMGRPSSVWRVCAYSGRAAPRAARYTAARGSNRAVLLIEAETSRAVAPSYRAMKYADLES